MKKFNIHFLGWLILTLSSFYSFASISVSGMTISNAVVSADNKLSFTWHFNASMNGCNLTGGNQGQAVLDYSPIASYASGSTCTSNGQSGLSCSTNNGNKVTAQLFFPGGLSTVSINETVQVYGLDYTATSPPAALSYTIRESCSGSSITNTVPLPVLPTVKTCTVNTASISVNLGLWSINDFSGVGSKTIDKDVSFNINCESAGVAVKAYLAADVDKTGGLDNVIKLTSGTNSASGVGIQMTNQTGKILSLNNINPIIIYSTLGNNAVNWLAHYIQTANEITEGTGNAVVTVILSYE